MQATPSLPAGGKVHLIGIGGAGMSAIAKVMLERGFEVSGSDLKRSRAALMLEAMGAHVHIGHHAPLVNDAAMVVVSSAIPANNPELTRARELGLNVVARGEALALLLQDRRSIVVAGTHGKTTTTSMITCVLSTAGLDPTYLVGAGLNDVGTNARHGHGELAVAEADESDGSFLLLEPHVAVVTNIEADHLDYWGSLDAIRDGFRRWLDRVIPGGTVVLPAEERELHALASRSRRTVVTFGAGGDVTAAAVQLGGGESRFVLGCPQGRAPVVLEVPGLHNVSNALAAAAACLAAGLAVAEIAHGLEVFRGVERRFQVRGEVAGITVIDDYAHHPTEVRATLTAARPGPWERLIALFQPHRYSRTAALAGEFGGSFESADQIVITDVYGAGEQPVPGVTGKLVSDAVSDRLPGRPIAYLPHRDEVLGYLQRSLRPGDAVLTLGAGDIYSVGEELLARLGSRR